MTTREKFANIVLIIWIVAFVLIIKFAISGLPLYAPGSMKVFFVVPAIGIFILSFILFRFSSETKIGIALLLISLGFSIYISEIFLEIYNKTARANKQPAIMVRQEYARKLGLPYDFRTRFQVWTDLKREDNNIYFSISPHQVMSHEGLFDNEAAAQPLGAISNTKLLACNESGEWITYLSDRYGFRNPDYVYDRDKIDTVLVGDSFLQGLCVKDGYDIAGWLRKMNYNAVTFGAAGNGPLVELASIKEYAEYFEPRYVIMFYFEGNDARNLNEEQGSPLLLKYFDKDFSQGLINKQEVIDNTLIKYHDELMIQAKKNTEKREKHAVRNITISLQDIVKLSNLRSRIGILPYCFFRIDPLFKELLVRADRMVSGWGGQFVIVYLPSWERYSSGTSSERKLNECDKRFYSGQKNSIFSLLKDLDIPYIDIDEVMRVRDPATIYPLDGEIQSHFNAEGYRLIADKVAAYIKGD